MIGCNRYFERLLKTSKLNLLGKDFNDFAEHFLAITDIEEKVSEQHKPLSQQMSVEHSTYFVTVAPFFSEQNLQIEVRWQLYDCSGKQAVQSILVKDLGGAKVHLEFACSTC